MTGYYGNTTTTETITGMDDGGRFPKLLYGNESSLLVRKYQNLS